MRKPPFQPRDFYQDIRTERYALGDASQLGRPWVELPPPEVLLVDPATVQFETPVDGRGLVDVRRLVTLCRSVVQPDYGWNIRQTRDDHLLWPEAAYAAYAAWLDDPLPMVFRNSPPSIVRFPLQFERLKHAITIPSNFPTLEVMHYRVESWVTARRLFDSIQDAVSSERQRRNRRQRLAAGVAGLIPKDTLDSIAEEYYADTLAANFRGVAMNLELHQKVPKEFRIVEPTDNAREILRLLGYQVKHRCRDGIRSRHSNFLPPRELQQPA